MTVSYKMSRSVTFYYFCLLFMQIFPFGKFLLFGHVIQTNVGCGIRHIGKPHRYIAFNDLLYTDIGINKTRNNN
jgi:hypothetical protein